MFQRHLHAVAALLTALAPFAGLSALDITGNGGSGFTIVLPASPLPTEEYAAGELREGIRKVSGADLPIVRAEEFAGPAIFIRTVEGPKDAISLRTADGSLELSGSAPGGVIYVVYEFLEKYCGIRWWTSWETFIPDRPVISVPDDLDEFFAPPIYEREIFYQNVNQHPDFASHLRCNGSSNHLPEEMGGHYDLIGFVHTFNYFIPRSEYLDEHPEYFEEIDGRRPGLPPEKDGAKHPTGNFGQLCPTNPEVQKLVTERVLEMLRAAKDPRLISVSQNDNRDYCRCSVCTASAEAAGGSWAAPLLELVNHVADAVAVEFPDVKVETLAYQYTRKPPENVRIADNVIIRLCSIECDFSKPLFDDANAAFRDDMEGWSRIAPELAVWNYVTNFHNYLTPQPNLRAQKLDTEFFASNHVTMLFQQGDYQSGCKAGDFVAMRAWILAKQAWDPSLEQEALMDEFLRGYYGEAAAELLKEYISIFDDEIDKFGKHYGCYSFNTLSWLSPEAVAAAFALKERILAAADADIPEARFLAAFQPLQTVYIERMLGDKDARAALCAALGRPLPEGDEFITMTEDYIRMLAALETDYFCEDWGGHHRLSDMSEMMRARAAELAKGSE